MIREFITADSFEDALRKKLDAKGQAHFLAGGTEMNRLGSSVSPEVAVSLKNLGLESISEAHGIVTIGAAVTLQALRDSVIVPAYLNLGFGESPADFCRYLYGRSVCRGKHPHQGIPCIP